MKDDLNNKLLKNIGKDHNKIIKCMTKNIIDTYKVYNQININIFETFKTNNLLIENIRKSVSKTLSCIINNYKTFDEIEKQYIKILIKSNWLAIIDFTYPQIKEIIREYKNTNFDDFVKKLDRKLIKYFNKSKLNTILNKWKKIDILKKRKTILENIIDAHVEKKYILSVPLTFIQIEAFIAEYCKHRGILSSKDLKEYIKKISNKSSLNRISDPIENLINEKIYTKFEWGAPVNSEISRHAILHGADIEYGTELNSLKLILLFDCIISISQMQLEKIER